MNQVSINNKKVYNVENDSEGNITINGAKLDWDLHKVNEKLFHIIYENESFIVELIKVELETKEATFKINGEFVDIKLRDKFDILLEKLGMSHLTVKKLKDIKAPMPGLILKILVKEGDEIEKDQALVILEAMKMENVIKSPIEGVISKVSVQEGENVEKNHKMIEFKSES